MSEVSQQEVKKFDAEVGKVLNLMIHSLYTNKEIFVRELISNASDACDKLRYLAQQDPKLLSEESDLKIIFSIDKDKRQLVIQDNGIGMNKDDLISNLGTIAKSGTQSFLDKLSGDAKKDSLLIGQFGVGFYSSFMVADKVTVISRKAGEKDVYEWSSNGEGEYTVAKSSEEISHGTKIIVSMKEDEDDYVDHFRVKNIVKTYSDHVAMPIYYKDDSDNEIQVNSSSALWMRPKADITEDQYKEFYKSVSFAADDPWLTMHNKNEGIVEFTNLLYVPTEKTFDLFHPDRKRRVKLYIRRVFITDENIELVPQYMRFLRGIVDSEDLPLNISRETLQHNPVLEKIKSSIKKRVINELKKKSDEDRESYEVFWQNFGAAFKEGLCEHMEEHDKLLEVCLFYSAKEKKMISIEEYLNKMKEGQKEIYYLTGENTDKLVTSPQLEGFISNDIDVLLLTDHVDDFWVNVVSKYNDHDIKSVTRIDTSPEENKEKDDNKDDLKDAQEDPKTLEFIKSTLGALVKDVRYSKKLTSSPVCLAVASGDMDIRMERFLVEQNQMQKTTAKILEINPKHKIICNLRDSLDTDAAKDVVKILFDQACIIEGEPVHDVADFSKRINSLMEQ